MSLYSSEPYYMYPFRFLLNKDAIQLIFIIILPWKIYYYVTSDKKASTWDIANSTYKTTNYIVDTINSIINKLILIIVGTYLIAYKLLHN